MPPLTQAYSFSTQSGYLTSSQYAQNSNSNPVDGVRRVTIRQLRSAEETNDPIGTFKIDGLSINRVMLVANVFRNDIDLGGQSIAYGFDDGTGRITGKGDSQEGGDPDFGSFGFARVTARLSKYRDAFYLNIVRIDRISDNYEVYYHILETIAQTVTLERGPPSPELLHRLATADPVDRLTQNLRQQAYISQQDTTGSTNNPGRFQAPPSPTSTVRADSPQHITLTTLQDDVLYCIRAKITNDNIHTGPHVEEFIPDIISLHPELTAYELKGAMYGLLDCGILETKDNKHYLCN